MYAGSTRVASAKQAAQWGQGPHQQGFYCTNHRVPTRQNWVHHEHVPLRDVIRELEIHERLLVLLHAGALQVGLYIIYRLWVWRQSVADLRVSTAQV